MTMVTNLISHARPLPKLGGPVDVQHEAPGFLARAQHDEPAAVGEHVVVRVGVTHTGCAGERALRRRGAAACARRRRAFVRSRPDTNSRCGLGLSVPRVTALASAAGRWATASVSKSRRRPPPTFRRAHGTPSASRGSTSSIRVIRLHRLRDWIHRARSVEA